MRKNIYRYLLCLVFLFNLNSIGAETQDNLSAKNVPADVILKRADKAVNQKSAELVKMVLAPDYKGKEHIFKGPLICGPFCWGKLLATGNFGKKNSGEAKFLIPMEGGKPKELEGRWLKDPGELLALEDYLRQIVQADGNFEIRAPNEKEFALYWAIISYDLQEPIFIIETKSHKFLLDFNEDSVFFFDDL
jgi:hypothetical protein